MDVMINIMQKMSTSKLEVLHDDIYTVS